MENNLTDKIVTDILENINSGVWKRGEFIPAMRTFAEEKGVSRGIVTAAVSVLVGKGVLERLPRRGIRVCDGDTQEETLKELAGRCVEIMNSRRSGRNNACRPEDVKAVRTCFDSIISEEIAATRQEHNAFISEEELMLYDKGLRCAGWSPDHYSLYGWNLSTNTPGIVRGLLLNYTFDDSDVTFDDITMDYVEKRLHPNDAGRYLSVMNGKSLRENAARQEYFSSIEYREKYGEEYRWIRLNLNASISKGTDDVMLYLLYQDIDEEKRSEMLLKERMEEDALTGALTRKAFLLQAEELLSESDETRQHAFLMLDIDGFKAINDTFGHPVGDTVLSDLSKALHTILRYGDLLGRIGGDEFVICLKDIPFDAVIDKKAERINELMRRSFNNNAKISGSIGIAIYPRDGSTYEQLYSRMDIALYHAKESGRDRYKYYKSGMSRSEEGITVADTIEPPSAGTENAPSVKKKILVVDDLDQNRDIINEMIKDEYTVLEAKDGRRALLTLRRYGTSISAVLLDLIMPGMSGFDVLRNMQREPTLQSIPVIIVSGLDDYENEFKAIEMGAVDFVKRPVDCRLLKLRIKNSVNKQETEKLRIQNSYLQLQGEEELRYRHIIQSTGTIVIEHDWVNSVFTYDKMISQYLAGSYDHRSLWHILLADMVASSMDVKTMQTMIYDLANSREQTQASMKVKLKTNTGERHWFSFNAIKTVDNFSIANRLLITLNDINEDVVVEERLRTLVEYDSLTGIYNRTAFLEKADAIIKRSVSGKWLLSVIDIDCFKVYNHLYGHDEGDRLLIYLAKQLDTAVGRYGGVCGRIQADSFAILHPSGRSNVDVISEICRKALRDHSVTMKIASCTGRCYIDDITLPINTILDRAMIAHRAAKNGRSNDVYFTDDMQRILLNEQKIVSKMEGALAEKQFCAFYQPIYEYPTNTMVTAEALVRWITPDGKIMPPGDFIPLFEQNGFIVRLDAYIWEAACESLRRWLDAGKRVVPISVNVSRMDLYSGTLVETITGLTRKYNIPPRLLRLEITESAYMENAEMIISHVEALQRLGFTIEMDDFGSGFSSLNILAEVPVDILKLDMKFIRSEDKTGRKRQIIGHIINMAKSSNIDVIAEGVETGEQADFLKSLGCFNMQGYYFSRPIPMSDFEKKLENNG